MTDAELIARLREIGKFSFGWTADRAADRIEALVRDAKAHEKEIVVWSENYAALERNLAKAMEALREIADRPDYRLPKPQSIASAVLAEIGGVQ